MAAFDDAKDVTRLMRSEQDSLADFRTRSTSRSWPTPTRSSNSTARRIPMTSGPGKTYRTGYAGPDLIHYTYVDNVGARTSRPAGTTAEPTCEFEIDTQTFVPGWADDDLISTFDFISWLGPMKWMDSRPVRRLPDDATTTSPTTSPRTASSEKPATWTGQRASPGKIQQAISEIVKARNAAYARRSTGPTPPSTTSTGPSLSFEPQGRIAQEDP